MTDISKDDALLWQEVVSDVQELKQTNKTSACKPQKKHILKKPTDTVPFYKNFNHTLELNTTADIDKRTFQRFKKEKSEPQAILDLHGLTVDEAYSKVHHFIISCYNQHKRTVLIITGKGLEHKEQDMFAPKGSLKQIVPEWLKESELKNMILSFIHPSPKLGGSGALYILLRRKKP